MLRSLLVGLDGSTYSDSAVSLGLRWARRAEALLVGLGVIDEPTIRAEEPVLLGGVPYADPIHYRARVADARRQVEQLLERFALRCAEAGVAAKLLEDVGLPYEQILVEAQRYDLILLGQQTRFHFETHGRDRDTVHKVLKSAPRPVVVTPESLPPGGAVMIAYDGSVQSARAVQAFAALGLGDPGPVHVVSVAAERKEAALRAERAIDYLRSHAIMADAHPVESLGSPAATLLDRARRLGAGLLVMGAYGQPTLREFALGSVTRTMLRESEIPLFLSH